MAVYKEEKTNTWRAVYRYTDWNGERKQTQKRGFKTKREAQAWEREQLNKTSADLDMTFRSFVDLYTADMKTRLKENTWATKDHMYQRSELDWLIYNDPLSYAELILNGDPELYLKAVTKKTPLD